MITLKRKPEVITAVKWTFDPVDPGKNNFAEIKRFCGNCARLETFQGLVINNTGAEYEKNLYRDYRIGNNSWIAKDENGVFIEYRESALNALFEVIEENEPPPPLPDQSPWCRACGARSVDYCVCAAQAEVE